ncbi:MAG: ferrous iron transport protein A [Clostridia bacterium]|nr:ferrous iron transport protein A [Clostridia bacterium]
MDLTKAIEGKEYIVKDIDTGDSEMDSFLFSLGCYSGAPIRVITKRRSGFTVAIKDARYSIDVHLARAIRI